MASGMMIAYSATLPQKRVVTDRIIMTDPLDIVAIDDVDHRSARGWG